MTLAKAFWEHVASELKRDLDTSRLLTLDGVVQHVMLVGDTSPKFWYRFNVGTPHSISWGHYKVDGGNKGGHKWIISGYQDDPTLVAALALRSKAANRCEFGDEVVPNARLQSVRAQFNQAKSGLVARDHEYLDRKGIAKPPSDWKITSYKFDGKESQPALMIGLHTVDSLEFRGAQFIAPDGAKRFAKGLPMAGLCYAMGSYSREAVVYICEGVATAHVVNRLTGCLTYACMSAGWFKRIACDVRNHFGPEAKIVVCAERGNGHKQAMDAALAVAAAVCMPPFDEKDSAKANDFDDFCRAHDDAETAEALKKFSAPEHSTVDGTANSAQAAWMEQRNEEWFAAEQWGNAGQAVYGRNLDGKVFPSDERTPRIVMANMRVPGTDADPFSFWRKHPLRRTYRKVAYDPEWQELDETQDLNLWRGFGVVPSRGDWGLMRQHIRENIAAGDESVYEHIIKLMAWIIQHPGQPCRVALVMLGNQGVGKGTLANAMVRIFGSHGYRSSEPGSLVGGFTGHLEYVSFLFADEMAWVGDHRFRQKLWGAITDPTIEIHHKNRTPYNARNCLNFMLATNYRHAAIVSKDDRRMFMVKVRDAWSEWSGAVRAKKLSEYFGPLYRQMESGGYEAMLYDLLHEDLSNFDVTAFPRTAALSENVQDSLDSLDSWFYSYLQYGWTKGTEVDKAYFYEKYRSEQVGRAVGTVKFWKRFKEVFGADLITTHIRMEDELGNPGRRRRVMLPPLESARGNASALWGFSVGGE